MATIKSYTDIEQSKKLAEFLPLESADWTILNCFNEFGRKDGSNIRIVKEVHTLNESVEKIPCWSLATLLDVLPEGTRLLKATNISSIGDTKYHCDCPKGNIDVWFDNPIDACYEMILKLHELNLL